MSHSQPPPHCHTETVRVRYRDTDQMGVVYYGNYLYYFEIARAEWLRTAGMVYRDLESQGFLLPVIEAHARYRAPARYDDLLEVDCVPAPSSRLATVRLAYQVRRGGVLLAEGYTVHACTTPEGRPRRIPPALRALLGPIAPAAAVRAGDRGDGEEA